MPGFQRCQMHKPRQVAMHGGWRLSLLWWLDGTLPCFGDLSLRPYFRGGEMQSQLELETVCAALKYWEEEMCPHGHVIMAPYFASTVKEPMSGSMVRDLRLRLAASKLRFGLVAKGRLDARLFRSARRAADQAVKESVVTILMPDHSDPSYQLGERNP